MTTKYQFLRMQVQDDAEASAKKDLAFQGEKPFAGINPDQAAAIKHGLIEYARSAAARTFDSLVYHGHLKVNKD